eukprot:gnl/TRDRNA2_/TRDRNA2_89260_c0_seq2.p1 gnl/TRDRNA2_/TRDRNA2_89260_c0~~gnl/TRDRNA2_/TRDRNA2_89260_c0_seq2.p1  ORF type:complete len:274 (+),score=52.82 gnl/TRDRNA2_/TRDRNA2_89260_c0_seq2:33-854(+)
MVDYYNRSRNAWNDYQEAPGYSPQTPTYYGDNFSEKGHSDDFLADCYYYTTPDARQPQTVEISSPWTPPSDESTTPPPPMSAPVYVPLPTKLLGEDVQLKPFIADPDKRVWSGDAADGWQQNDWWQPSASPFEVPPPPFPVGVRSNEATTKLCQPLPTRGSKNHASGHCRPCKKAFTPEGCPAGEKCNFCHFSHNKLKMLEAALYSAKASIKRERAATEKVPKNSGSNRATGARSGFGSQASTAASQSSTPPSEAAWFGAGGYNAFVGHLSVT